MSSATHSKLMNLYNHGNSPSKALQLIKSDIEDNLADGERLDVAMANRSICPDDQQCQHVFRKLVFKEYGKSSDSANLSEFVEKMNREIGVECVATEEHNGKRNGNGNGTTN